MTEFFAFWTEVLVNRQHRGEPPAKLCYRTLIQNSRQRKHAMIVTGMIAGLEQAQRSLDLESVDPAKKPNEIFRAVKV